MHLSRGGNTDTKSPALPPCQVFAAFLAQEISKGALEQDACRCLQWAPLMWAKQQEKMWQTHLEAHTQANMGPQDKPLFVCPSCSSLSIKSNNCSWNSCVSEWNFTDLYLNRQLSELWLFFNHKRLLPPKGQRDMKQKRIYQWLRDEQLC